MAKFLFKTKIKNKKFFVTPYTYILELKQACFYQQFYQGFIILLILYNLQFNSYSWSIPKGFPFARTWRTFR